MSNSRVKMAQSYLLEIRWFSIDVHGKGDGVPVHAMKAYRGNRGIAPLMILKFGARSR
jgi:hypothetical protein